MTRLLQEWTDVLCWQLLVAIEIAERARGLTPAERHRLATFRISAEHDRGMIDVWLHPTEPIADTARLERLLRHRERRLAALGPAPTSRFQKKQESTSRARTAVIRRTSRKGILKIDLSKESERGEREPRRSS